MSAIHYIKLIAKKTQWKVGPFNQRDNTGFSLGTGAPYYMERLTYSVGFNLDTESPYEKWIQ